MYPTTLREISYPFLIKLCAELNGKRYLLGQAKRYEPLDELTLKYRGRGDLYLYTTENSDSTHIAGGEAELIAALS